MSVIDKELWANLYIFCYSAPNRSTSLVSNYRTHPAACSLEGRASGRETEAACHLFHWEAGQGVGCQRALLLLPGQRSPSPSCTLSTAAPVLCAGCWERAVTPTENPASLWPPAFGPLQDFTHPGPLGTDGPGVPPATPSCQAGPWACGGVGIRTRQVGFPGAGCGRPWVPLGPLVGLRLRQKQDPRPLVPSPTAA